jgi:DNA-binding transcriptional LysR family regulator
MPQSLARHCVLPRIGEFLQQYPDLELILCSSDNVEDIIQEGFDCVIRTGRIEDSTTLVARPLARYRWMVLASPAWLAAHGRPQSIDDLHQHRAVGYLNHRTGRTIDWLFSSMTAIARSACRRRWWSTIPMPISRPAFRGWA